MTPCKYILQHTPTHTHPFNGHFSGTTQVSRYQKGKTNLDFTEARDSEWQWHQLEHMQVCTWLQTDNHASISPLSFFTGMPLLPPNQQRQSTEGLNTYYSSVRVLTRHVSFMRICNCHIFRILPHFSHISGKCVRRIFFPHKLVFSMAILILIVFLLPISIRFRYLDHLVANRMASFRCLDPCEMSWGSCFK